MVITALIATASFALVQSFWDDQQEALPVATKYTPLKPSATSVRVGCLEIDSSALSSSNNQCATEEARSRAKTKVMKNILRASQDGSKNTN